MSAQVEVVGNDYSGGLVGGNFDGSLLECTVQAQVSGHRNIGGLAGLCRRGSIIECRSSGIVVGSDNVGGLIGDAYRTMIWKSAAHGEIVADTCAGALVGYFRDQTIMDSYAQGSIGGATLGGLCGEGRNQRFVNCYAACEMTLAPSDNQDPTKHGLIGEIDHHRPTLVSDACFWDAELSQTTKGSNADGQAAAGALHTQQMQDIETFLNAGWDFNRVWTMGEAGYPRLQGETRDCHVPDL